MKKEVNQSKTPLISYDKDKNKPMVLNEAAALELIDVMEGHRVTSDFQVDEDFLEHYKEVFNEENPSQEEINNYIISLVRDCPEEVAEEDFVTPVQIGDTVGFHEFQKEEFIKARAVKAKEDKEKEN